MSQVDLRNDLLRGVREISEFTGESPRRTNYLLERGLLPAGKVGSLWVASRRRLREHYEQVTNGQLG